MDSLDSEMLVVYVGEVQVSATLARTLHNTLFNLEFLFFYYIQKMIHNVKELLYKTMSNQNIIITRKIVQILLF